MKDIIIGTAGHVDHGKTALIKALTGFEGDTLAQEKERGITIDLSFSCLKDSETNIAFIDVPGHDKLVKNMIAGAFGFDASMIVIDVNEGIMPQTHEHIGILNLLKVSHCIIALSKIDLSSKEQIKMRIDEIQKYMQSFENLNLISIIPVSIYDSQTIDYLKSTLLDIPSKTKTSKGLFRYYIDRSFSISGVGSIVTGTILDGEISVNDKVWIAQSQTEVKIRNLQVHDNDVSKAYASQRVAINLQNPKIIPKKGMLLSKKGFMRGFESIDVIIESIANRKLKHDTKVIFHAGTMQVEAKILLYDNKESLESGFARLVFGEKMYMSFDEPFIITISGRVIAGGRVLNPINDPIKKRVKLELLRSLHQEDFTRAFEILVDSHRKGFGLVSSSQRFGLSHQEALDIANEIDAIVVDIKSLVLYPIQILDELEDTILAIYDKNPHALLSAKSLSFKLKWASEDLLKRVLQKLEDDDSIILNNGVYQSANIEINNIEELVENQIFDILETSDISPDAPYNIYDGLDVDRKIGDDALKKLTAVKRVTRLTHNLFIVTRKLDELMCKLRVIIEQEGYIDISNFKQHYPLSRKYLVAYLEHLDSYNDIKRDGNKRVQID